MAHRPNGTSRTAMAASVGAAARARALADVTDTQVQAIRDRLNRRPRLVLKGQNPSKTFNGANTT
ncbi:hypothetical protein BKH04_10595 [Actinomyces naeslundii]|nr:hypothetical protein BKH04_10595 [Actinomyces naeslundii]